MTRLWRIVLGTLRDLAPVVAVIILFQLFVVQQPLLQLYPLGEGALLVLAGLILLLYGLELALFPGRRYPSDQFPAFEQLMQERDNMVQRNPKTTFVIAHMGWHANDLARLGKMMDEMPNILVYPFENIRPGNAAMYYPESNVLVSRHADPYSKTPAFKCVEVEIVVKSRSLVTV